MGRMRKYSAIAFLLLLMPACSKKSEQKQQNHPKNDDHPQKAQIYPNCVDKDKDTLTCTYGEATWIAKRNDPELQMLYPQFAGPVCKIPDGSVIVEKEVIPPGWNLEYEATGKPVIPLSHLWWCK